MQQHQRAGQNALSGPFLSSTPLRTNLTKRSPSLTVELVVGFVPRAGRVCVEVWVYTRRLVPLGRVWDFRLLRKVPMSETRSKLGHAAAEKMAVLQKNAPTLK